MGGVSAVGPPTCHHQGFPLLVFQDFALIQNLHSLLPNLSASAVELVAIQYAQLQCTAKSRPLYAMFRLLSTSHSSRISLRCSPTSRHLLLNLLPSSIHSCSAQPSHDHYTCCSGFSGPFRISICCSQSYLSLVLSHLHSCNAMTRLEPSAWQFE